jgi:hypothetical protein
MNSNSGYNDARRYPKLLRLDVVKQLNLIRALEWWTTGEEFEENGANAPEVGFGVIFTKAKNLRCHIQWTST